MNTYHYKNNTYKNGWYRPDHSKAMEKEKAKSIEPTTKQEEYRDVLYKFCVQKGIVGDGFKMQRTNRGISANINALRTIIVKNGFADEFWGERKDNDLSKMQK